MARLGRVLSAVAVGASAAILPISVHAQSGSPASVQTARAGTTRVAMASTSPVPRTSPAPVRAGSLSGVVSDERGGPLRGAMVSAVSPTAMASAVSDQHGRYAIDALPVGEYVVRAHMVGFAASRRASVRVAGPATIVPQLQLRRIDNVAATTGSTDTALPARPIVAAGFQLPQGEKAADDEDGVSGKDSHPHTETAWRLRHIKRSILKNENGSPLLLTEREAFGGPIIENQGVSFPLADSLTELHAARLLTYHAAHAFDTLRDRKVVHGKVAMAKLYASEMAGRVADRSVQILGGRGYMHENAAARFYRELRVDRIWEGTSEIQRLIIARGLQKRGAAPYLGWES